MGGDNFLRDPTMCDAMIPRRSLASCVTLLFFRLPVNGLRAATTNLNMFAARVLARRRAPFLLRANSSLSATETSAPANPPPPPPLPSQSAAKAPSPSSHSPSSSAAPESEAEAKDKPRTGGRRKRITIKHRPPISLEHPRKWNPPVKPGSLPAYDEALKYIEADAARLRKELEEVRVKVTQLEKSGDDAEGLEKLREKVGILEIQSEVNRPSVRWEASNGMGASCL